MWLTPNYASLVMYHDWNTTFPMSEETIGPHGKWVFLKSLYKDDTVSTGIWHSTQPLMRLHDAKTCQIIDLMENELYKWLDPYSMTPLAIPKLYQLVCS